MSFYERWAEYVNQIALDLAPHQQEALLHLRDEMIRKEEEAWEKERLVDLAVPGSDLTVLQQIPTGEELIIKDHDPFTKQLAKRISELEATVSLLVESHDKTMLCNQQKPTTEIQHLAKHATCKTCLRNVDVASTHNTCALSDCPLGL